MVAYDSGSQLSMRLPCNLYTELVVGACMHVCGPDRSKQQAGPTVRGLGGWGVHMHAFGCEVVACESGTTQSPAPPPKPLVETIDLV